MDANNNKIREIKNNKVIISGTVASGPKFNHEVFGEKFYVFNLDTKRISETVDTIPIMVSERLVYIDEIENGKRIRVEGQYRSYNDHKNNRNRLILSVFARSMEYETDNNDKNKVELEGYICKSPIYRETPMGREITDLLVAVNRPYGKADYIPCVVWGRNATFASELDIGTKIVCTGRIQIRQYNKKIDEQMSEVRVAYEVSVNKIWEVDENEYTT